jgi:FkbM family methyltransferase
VSRCDQFLRHFSVDPRRADVQASSTTTPHRICLALSREEGNFDILSDIVHIMAFSIRAIFSKILRWLFSLIPPDTKVRILRGPIRGMKWVKGAGPNSCWIGTYELVRIREFTDALKLGDVVYDVGANVGIYSLYASVKVGNSGSVYAFEPLERNLNYLRQHLSLNNLQNCTVLATAICHTEGTLAFSAADWQPSMGRLSTSGEIKVPSTTLDSCVYGEKRLRPPSLIKIDVEGAEFEVLSGATKSISEFHPIIFLEIHGTELHRSCCEFLLAKGYSVEEGYGQLTANWKPTNH